MGRWGGAAFALRNQINDHRVVKEKKATMTEVYRGRGGGWGGSEYSCAYSHVGKNSKSAMCVSFLQRVLESCGGGGD